MVSRVIVPLSLVYLYGVGYYARAATFALAFVADGHAHLADAVHEVGSGARVFLELLGEIYEILFQRLIFL